MTSSDAIIDLIAEKDNALGYSGIGYARPGVRAVPLTKESVGEYVDATPGNAVSGKYPLSRFLYVYVNKKPGEALPQMQADFIRLVMSWRRNSTLSSKSPSAMQQTWQRPPYWAKVLRI